jgi:hypothetical protein
MAEAVRIAGPAVGPGMKFGSTDAADEHADEDRSWTWFRGWRLDHL